MDTGEGCEKLPIVGRGFGAVAQSRGLERGWRGFNSNPGERPSEPPPQKKWRKFFVKPACVTEPRCKTSTKGLYWVENWWQTHGGAVGPTQCAAYSAMMLFVSIYLSYVTPSLRTDKPNFRSRFSIICVDAKAMPHNDCLQH